MTVELELESSSSGQRRNKRQSAKHKHQKGESRRKSDRFGNKGYKFPPRKRPPQWKDPWPPESK